MKFTRRFYTWWRFGSLGFLLQPSHRTVRCVRRIRHTPFKVIPAITERLRRVCPSRIRTYIKDSITTSSCSIYKPCRGCTVRWLPSYLTSRPRMNASVVGHETRCTKPRISIVAPRRIAQFLLFHSKTNLRETINTYRTFQVPSHPSPSSHHSAPKNSLASLSAKPTNQQPAIQERPRSRNDSSRALFFSLTASQPLLPIHLAIQRRALHSSSERIRQHQLAFPHQAPSRYKAKPDQPFPTQNDLTVP